MDAETRDRLKGGFDEVAATYAAARPAYPDAAVEWLLGGRTSDVLDLGAGSGALTRSLAARATFVVAAEPSHHLLRELQTAAPATATVQGSAERLPFRDASFDVVTVATAFHWFDHGLALPEMARVLRPGGHLGLAWNTRTSDDPCNKDLAALLRSARPPSLQGHWGPDSVTALDESAQFAASEHAEFRHVQRLDREGLVGLVSSRSYVIALAVGERADLLARAAALFDTYADDGLVEVAYRCECWRVAVATD